MGTNETWYSYRTNILRPAMKVSFELAPYDRRGLASTNSAIRTVSVRKLASDDLVKWVANGGIDFLVNYERDWGNYEIDNEGLLHYPYFRANTGPYVLEHLDDGGNINNFWPKGFFKLVPKSSSRPTSPNEP